MVNNMFSAFKNMSNGSDGKRPFCPLVFQVEPAWVMAQKNEAESMVLAIACAWAWTSQ